MLIRGEDSAMYLASTLTNERIDPFKADIPE